MGDSFYLAWNYLRYHRWTTAVLIASMTLILFLPAGLQTIVNNAERHFRSRADTTPLLVGPRGSSLDLVLSATYFDKPLSDVMRNSEYERIKSQQIGTTIPLHFQYTAQECPVVGTSEDYFAMRGLSLREGHLWEILGECVLGSNAATRLGVGVGGRVPVESSSAFVLRDAPLRLNVVGVIAPQETPDDDAIFVSLDTTWVIDGLGHGHVKKAKHGSQEAEPFTDITPENVDSFHFHGNRTSYPLSAVIVHPESEKDRTILLGQYFSPDKVVQIVKPREVMDRLLSRVLMVRSYLITIIALVSCVTLALVALSVVLSIRLRRAELVTISKMGGSRFKIISILTFHVLAIFAVSLVIASGLTLTANHFGAELVRLFVL